MRDFRPGCLIELVIAALILWALVLALPYTVTRNSHPGPGTLDPVLNHEAYP
jgi:hypothetical protein